MNGKCLRLIGMCVALASAVALADWNVHDGAVMTPQLPTGDYDVMVDSIDKPLMLADDWQASQTHAVTDAHLWYSWRDDLPGIITQIRLAIYEAGPVDSSGEPSAVPGVLRWSGAFRPNAPLSFEIRSDVWSSDPGNSSGWNNPWSPSDNVVPDNPQTPLIDEGGNHGDIYQVNINNLWGSLYDATGQDTGRDGYFGVLAGNYYWLAAVIDIADRWGGPYGTQLGWHTTATASGLGAVYNTAADIASSVNWDPLLVGGDRVDMAFVMTPEPGALGLLLLGGASLALGRRRRVVVADQARCALLA